MRSAAGASRPVALGVVAVCALLSEACGSEGSSAGPAPRERPSTPEKAPAAESARRLLNVGAPAPALVLEGHESSRIALGERDRALVVFFFPKSGSPGCAAEASAFDGALEQLRALEADVIGVSMDARDVQLAFAREHDLDFPLVADADGRVARAFGVPERAGMVERTTFIIGPSGKVVRVFPQVVVREHVREVLAALRELRGE